MFENGNDIWGIPQIEKRRTCMLMITYSCNLNCTYCYEKHKSDKKMSFDLAKKLILKECDTVKNDSKYDGLEIALMGGEPMTNFPLIKQLVEWAESIDFPVPYIFFLTSNGTLYDDESKAWFTKHKKHIYVGVSYDGTPEMQKTNRGERSKAIDFDFFIKTWPEQGFHMTISKETLPYLAEGILSLQRRGGTLFAALANGIEWSEEDAELYSAQLAILEEAYLNDSSICPINILTNYLNVCLTDADLHEKQEKYCGSGTYMVTYDVDGKAYGCHMFTPIVMGEDAVETGKINWTCQESIEDPYCQNCILKRICPSCSGFNLRFRGHIARRDHRWCKLVLAQTLRACEFQIRILANRRKQLNERDAAYAQAALKAYDVLKNFSLNSVAPYTLNVITPNQGE